MIASRRLPSWVAMATACALVASCTGDGDGSSATTAAPAATTATTSGTEVSVDDGVLRIGVLLPLSGGGVELGQSMVSAVELAVDEVNRAGGVLGQPMVLAAVEDEGDGVDIATAAAERLLREPIDAIIGPASSLAAPLVLPITRAAGVLTCSPAATSASLDDFPDSRLFVRTIGSDSLQALAMARVIDQSGVSSAAIVYIDDDFGRPFAQSLADELARLSIAVRHVAPFASDDTDFADNVANALIDQPAMVAVIGEASTGPRLVEQLFVSAPDTLQVVVNDAMRVPAAPDAYARLEAAALERLRGVSPRSTSLAGDFGEQFAAAFPDQRDLFATNAYDCVTVMALAANAAASTSAADIGRAIPALTAGGSGCNDYTACVTLQQGGRNVDYDGPSGQLQIGTDGDLTRAVFDVFGFDERGVDESRTLLVVSS